MPSQYSPDNAGCAKWVVDTTRKQLEKAKTPDREGFLRCLRDDPNHIKYWINRNLQAWTLYFTVETCEVCLFDDIQALSEMIFEGLKSAFAEEIKTLPST